MIALCDGDSFVDYNDGWKRGQLTDGTMVVQGNHIFHTTGQQQLA
jgi:hypothetical protein